MPWGARELRAPALSVLHAAFPLPALRCPAPPVSQADSAPPSPGLVLASRDIAGIPERLCMLSLADLSPPRPAWHRPSWGALGGFLRPSSEGADPCGFSLLHQKSVCLQDPLTLQETLEFAPTYLFFCFFLKSLLWGILALIRPGAKGSGEGLQSQNTAKVSKGKNTQWSELRVCTSCFLFLCFFVWFYCCFSPQLLREYARNARVIDTSPMFADLHNPGFIINGPQS